MNAITYIRGIKMARTKQDIPEGETKEQRFARIANPRLKKAVAHLRNVAKMGKANAYAVSTDDLEKIKDRLYEEVDNVVTSLESKTKESKEIEDVF